MSPERSDLDAHLAAEAAARRSYGKLVAILAIQTRDVGVAEDALAEAFASALEHWPTTGCPSNPDAWLLSAARNKVIDAVRRQRSAELATFDLQILAEQLDSVTASTTAIPDHRLALMFACAHPSIEIGTRAPLMLQVVLGLAAQRIASAFLTSPGTMGQRLTRAKNKIRQAGIPFRVPERHELPSRLDGVLDAIYAVFGEGCAASDGCDVVRRDLAEEGVFLGRLVTELVPEAPEASGLLALMLYIEARRGARWGPNGEYVPLSEQNTAGWDSPGIEEAEARLLRARELGPIGRYQLEAALQSAHIFRCRTGKANWEAVQQLYDALFAVTGSPIVAVNRALVVAELRGPHAGLEAIEQIGDARLTEYQPYWAARAELLANAGRRVEAREAYEVAISLERDPAVRVFLQRRQLAEGHER
jgi:predicted RNA polymerase sigma factor